MRFNLFDFRGTAEMKFSFSKIIFRFPRFLSLFVIIFLAFIHTDYTRGATETLPATDKISENILKLYPKGSCGSELGKYNGSSFVVVACDSSFLEQNRQEFLDLMFRYGLKFVGEEMKFARKTGHYFYTFSYVDPTGLRKLYVKLHFRNSYYLYKNPFNTGRIAILVDNLANIDELILWQTLGLRLSYAVVPFKETTTELGVRINEYNQGLWVSLSLNPIEMSSDLGSVLSVEEALEAGLVEPYVQRSLQNLKGAKGMIDRNGKDFLKNIAALRQLFAALQKYGITHYLDSLNYKGTAAVETARIMNLNSLRPTLAISNCRRGLSVIRNMTKVAQKNELTIVKFRADDKLCVRQLQLAKKKGMFKKLEFINLTM